MMPYPPLGLLYLSSHLKARGHRVVLHDTTFAGTDSFRAALDEHRPAVVGLYVTLMTRAAALEMITASRKAGAWVVLGGPEPAPNAAEYLAHGAHAVVVGEGEQTLDELLHHLPVHGLRGLESIAGLRIAGADGEVIATPPRALLSDLSVQPWPDREAVAFERYLETWRRHHGHTTVSLITSRGCPFTCAWCSHDVFGRSHRRRRVDEVADEVEAIVGRWAPDRLWYADDVFTLNRPWVARYAAELGRRGLRVPFECISRADRLDETVADALADMGCRRLWIGSESGSQRILDRMLRLTSVEDVQDKTTMLQARGIEVGMFIMLGYEGEEESDLAATVDLLTTAVPDIVLTTVAYPIRGTEYYRDVKEKIVAGRPWDQRNDRELGIRGRHSRRYYRHATRWMVNEYRLARARSRGDVGLAGRARARAAAVAGRLGMWMSRNDRELDGAGRGWQTQETRERKAST